MSASLCRCKERSSNTEHQCQCGAIRLIPRLRRHSPPRICEVYGQPSFMKNPVSGHTWTEDGPIIGWTVISGGLASGQFKSREAAEKELKECLSFQEKFPETTIIHDSQKELLRLSRKGLFRGVGRTPDGKIVFAL